MGILALGLIQGAPEDDDDLCKERARPYSNAAAPETISVSSVVICAWRARL
jgi:hypothetical protein